MMKDELRMKLAAALGKLSVAIACLDDNDDKPDIGVGCADPWQGNDPSVTGGAVSACLKDAGVAATSNAGVVPVVKMGGAGAVIAGHKVADIRDPMAIGGTKVASASAKSLASSVLGVAKAVVASSASAPVAAGTPAVPAASKPSKPADIQESLNDLKSKKGLMVSKLNKKMVALGVKPPEMNASQLTVQNLIDMLEAAMKIKED